MTPPRPNIVVVLHGATQTKRNVNTFYSGMGGYGYRYGGFGGMGTAQTVVNEYTVGTLVVDMFDAKTKNLVFRGTAEDEISDNAEKNAKRLEKASTKLFKNFPPTKRSSARHEACTPSCLLRPAAGGPFFCRHRRPSPRTMSPPARCDWPA